MKLITEQIEDIEILTEESDGGKKKYLHQRYLPSN